MSKKTVQLDDKGFRKFGMRDKVAYAAGDFGCNMSFALKGTVQTFWLVYMFMNSKLLAALVLVAQIWDAINDPLLGSMIDRDTRKYKMGKFKTYIFVGACGLLVAGALVFLPLPESIRISQETKDVILKSVAYLIAYVIWDACYTVANVPYGSMLSLVTEDKVQQAELSTWRSIGGMVGGMIPGVLLNFIIWENVVYDGTTDFLNKIVIPEGFTKEQFLINPNTGLPYNIGDKVLSPETGKQVQILLVRLLFLL